MVDPLHKVKQKFGLRVIFFCYFGLITDSSGAWTDCVRVLMNKSKAFGWAGLDGRE